MWLVAIVLPTPLWAGSEVLPSPVQQRLDNGLRVVFQFDPASPIVAVCAFVHTSAAQETWNATGVRQLLQLMGEQARPPAGEGESQLPPVALLHMAVSRDYVETILRCLPEDFPDALRRLRWALFDPDLSQEPFRYAQQRLEQEVMARQTSPVALAQDVLVTRLYPQWPGSWPLIGVGTATGVDLSYARDFHRKHYLSDATVLAICGGLPWETVGPEVARTFGVGNVPRGTPPALAAPVAGAEPNTEPLVLKLTGSEVSAVALGGRAPALEHPDYAAAAVMTALLGAGRGSRLYQRLREEQNVSYTIQADLAPSQVCPYVFCLATCSADKLDAVRTTMLAETARLCTQPASAEEVIRARRMVAGQFLLQQQDAVSLAHFLGLFVLFGRDRGMDHWRSFAERLNEVQPEQVQAMARQVLTSPAVVAVRGGASS